MTDLVLTGEFELIVAERSLAIPHMAERVVAYLALAQRPVTRIRLSGTLWPDTPAKRAAKNLRSVFVAAAYSWGQYGYGDRAR